MQLNFTKATKAKVKARVAIDGPSGAGKTYSALILATVLADGKKIAVIDTERGSASLYSDKFDFDVLELDSYSPAIYTQAIDAAEQAGYGVIVIDSLSHAWEGEGGALDMVDQKSTQIKGNSYAAWKDVTPLHRRMVDKMLQSPAHVIVTMRSKMDYVQETDGNGKKIIRKVGMAPVQRSGMEYEFTIVADMDVDHHIAISKSRCDEMADKVAHKPGPDFWKHFSAWLADGVEKPAIAKPAPAPVETEQPKEVKAPPAPAPVNPARPYAAETLRKKIEASAATYAMDKATASDPQRKIMAAAIDGIFGDKLPTRRYELCLYLTGKSSTKDIPAEHVLAVLKWLGNGKADHVGFEYQADEITRKEAHAAHEAALLAKGQTALLPD